MTRKFSELPLDHNLNEAADAVRDVIELLHRTLSYEAISEAVHNNTARTVTSTSIRAFLHRRRDTVRYHRTNGTLAALYDLVLSDYPFPYAVAQKIAAHANALHSGRSTEANLDYVESSLAFQFQDWLAVAPTAPKDLLKKLLRKETGGNYVLVRRSRRLNTFVQSSIKITEISGPRSLIAISHKFRDAAAVWRFSRGVLVPVKGNIYGVLQIENGEGLELLAFREPIQKDFERMIGSITSIDMGRNIIATPAILEPAVASWEGLGERFSLDEMDDFTKSRVEILTSFSIFAMSDIFRKEL